MASKPSWIERKAISQDVLKRIYASDQDMYPVPLSFERLQNWVAQSLELSVCYLDSAGEGCDSPGNAVEIGAVIVLPLRKNQWEELLVGKLKEIEVDASTMFGSSDADEPQDVGLHIFHIERFEGYERAKLQRFAEFVLEDVREAATRYHWNILGYSALTATPAGRKAFDRMSFKPTGYEELFSQATSDSTEMPEMGINMLFKYPEGQGADLPELSQSHQIVFKSAMVVRFGNGGFWDDK